jgi:hypothetical protein
MVFWTLTKWIVRRGDSKIHHSQAKWCGRNSWLGWSIYRFFDDFEIVGVDVIEMTVLLRLCVY